MLKKQKQTEYSGKPQVTPIIENSPKFTGTLIRLVSVLIFALNLVPFLKGMFVMLMMGV